MQTGGWITKFKQRGLLFQNWGEEGEGAEGVSHKMIRMFHLGADGEGMD